MAIRFTLQSLSVFKENKKVVDLSNRALLKDLLIAAAIPIGLGLIAWGAMDQKVKAQGVAIEDLESHIQSNTHTLRDVETNIAVIREQLINIRQDLADDVKDQKEDMKVIRELLERSLTND